MKHSRLGLLVLGALLLAAAAAAGVLLLLLDRVAGGASQYLLQRGGTALGRTLSVEHVSVSLRGGPAVRLQGVRVGEDPAFGTGDFVRLTRSQPE